MSIDSRVRHMRTFIRKHPAMHQKSILEELAEGYSVCLGSTHPSLRLFVCVRGYGYELFWETYHNEWDFDGRKAFFPKGLIYQTIEDFYTDFKDEIIFLDQRSLVKNEEGTRNAAIRKERVQNNIELLRAFTVKLEAGK